MLVYRVKPLGRGTITLKCPVPQPVGRRKQKRDKPGSTIQSCPGRLETESAKAIHGAWMGEVDKSSGVFSKETQRQERLASSTLCWRLPWTEQVDWALGRQSSVPASFQVRLRNPYGLPFFLYWHWFVWIHNEVGGTKEQRWLGRTPLSCLKLSFPKSTSFVFSSPSQSPKEVGDDVEEKTNKQTKIKKKKPTLLHNTG